MLDFHIVVYNSLQRHNTNSLSYSMHKIDEKYVPSACYGLVSRFTVNNAVALIDMQEKDAHTVHFTL